ncbi:MAG: TfoX/Sxy family DNA transformation protein [Bacteroidales bacterium]|nr:TfoX/Sxy family DNA transformation protein [Bacteroidales bacterium]
MKQVEIGSEHDLKSIGSENAFVKILTVEDCGPCINMLYALEGAVQGIRCH